MLLESFFLRLFRLTWHTALSSSKLFTHVKTAPLGDMNVSEQAQVQGPGQLQESLCLQAAAQHQGSAAQSQS